VAGRYACTVLQLVAVICSVLQCSSLLQCVTMWCRESYKALSVRQVDTLALCCSLLQCDAVCCSVLQCSSMLQFVAVCCNVVQGELQSAVCVVWQVDILKRLLATHCSALQHTATHCNTLQHTATHETSMKVCSLLTATHCNTLQHTATQGNTRQHMATHKTFSKVCSLLTVTHGNTRQNKAHTATHSDIREQTATD